ncbi:nicotinate-nucleotide adenylyltransferase [Desulfitobacterium sp.]|uniref:nicotinate-nucleotide adenylyltransferase n=1 Tax=Desulfitobacterium sp. TaxID=49981 RepID=UPI002B21E28F|nr:nicotinate-nucleotide adenylyltransferase [Desulfitobacterium sp.]MEA4902310.1 nicotinate-nucleotide adenylyltransferase [Desulfitobacterium sp.]
MNKTHQKPLSRKRLGIMGGTFDPIHYGHLVAAEMARNEFALERVIFIPTGIPPHKRGRKITCSEYRYAMVSLAIADNELFDISRIELDRMGLTYTVDTLRLMQEQYSDFELYFITGADAFREIFTWHNPNEVLALTQFIGASRPGFDADTFLKRIQQEYPEFYARMHSLEVPALAISSTDIRARVKKGQSIRYLLPEPVRLYIKEKGLYRD